MSNDCYLILQKKKYYILYKGHKSSKPGKNEENTLTINFVCIDWKLILWLITASTSKVYATNRYTIADRYFPTYNLPGKRFWSVTNF